MADARLELAGEPAGGSGGRGLVPSPLPPDDPEAWYAPDVQAQYEVHPGVVVTAAVDTFQRADGSQQVVADGWPLYYYGSDREPGEVRGQGVNDVWWVLDPSGMPRRVSGAGTSDATGTDSTDPSGY